MKKKIIINVNRLNDSVICFSNKFNRTPKYVEFIFWSFFMVLFIFAAVFHEPWADELQSFMIAKEASYTEMILDLGHGEGHPAIWWLLLSVFAKNGFSADFSLKILSFIINIASSYIMIFKFKVPKIYRILLPYTYFIIYQYGVVSRCYCLMVLGFCLLTLYWNHREKKYFQTVISMILICLSSAYGIALMFGLALVWCYNIVKEILADKNNTLKAINKHKYEILSLFLLALVALIIVILIWPSKEAYAMTKTVVGSGLKTVIKKIYYLLMLEPIDALFFSSTYEDMQLASIEPDLAVWILGGFISLIYWVAVFMIPETYGMRKVFVIPHSIFVIVSGLGFFMTHHIGITTIFFLFWVCTCYEKYISLEESSVLAYKKTKYGNYLFNGEGKVLIKYRYLLFILPIFVSIGWTFSSILLDTKVLYSPNKKPFDYISSYSRDRTFSVYTNNLPEFSEYKNDNIILYKDYYKGRNVSFWVLDETDEEMEIRDDMWRELGYPDIVTDFSNGILEIVNNGNNELIPKYRILDAIDSGKVFKGVQDSYSITLFMREDLADELGGLGVNKVKVK